MANFFTDNPDIQFLFDHFDLATYFERVYGSELDGANSTKADLIATILAEEDLEPSDVCMIGDRSHDVVGGLANHTHTIGVLWGFGSEAELRQAKPDAVVDSMAALPEAWHLITEQFCW